MSSGPDEGDHKVGRFILSLDCEGKWGVADQLGGDFAATLDDERLKAGYSRLIGLLDEFEMPATFAFVGTFSLGPAELRDLRPALHDLARTVPGYLEPALADGGRPGANGWTGDWAVAAVDAARTPHEIALHGATHIPWDWPGMTAAVARQELGLLYEVGAPILDRVTTYIYPRNAVQHREVLAEFGIAGARDARSPRSRVSSLLSEFDVRAAPDPDPPLASPLRIPAGYFVNWLSGLRRAVPPAVTLWRARQMLRRAAQTGDVVHFWTHPENLVSAPATHDLLRGILAEVSRLRDAGRCEVLTQEQFCRRVDPSHVDGAVQRRDAARRRAS